MSSQTNPPPANFVSRLLNGIEWAGNKLPDPAVLFLIALVVTWVLSWPLSTVSFPYVNPKSQAKETQRILQSTKAISASTAGLMASPFGMGPLNTFAAVGAVAAPQAPVEKIEVRNLLTGTELVAFLTKMVENFTHFPPLGIVLVAMLGVGVAEHTGFINALIKAMLGVTPQKLLTPMVLLVAIVSHTAGDTGYIVVIPLAGIIFAAAGRHPVAGIVCAFAGVSGGFSANFIPSGLDPLLQGFTQSAANILDPSRQVNVFCNYIFMATSCALIVLVGWVLTDWVIEPKLKSTSVDGDPADMPVMEPLGAAERRGMAAGLISLAIFFVLLVVACLPADSPFLHPDNSMPYWRRLTDFHAPIMQSIVPLIFLMFLIPGIVHGLFAGSIKSHRDIIKGMSKSMSTMGYYLVLVFFAGQFIYGFRQSNLGVLLAVSGADFLKHLGLPEQVTVVGILLLSSLVNLLVGSASAKWALLGPIFVPMLMPLGISPELTQAAYRIGDSSTNIITPLMPYFPLIVVYAQRYVKKTGIGTLISLMLPFSLCFLITWTLLLLVFWQFGLPLGIPPDLQYYPQ